MSSIVLTALASRVAISLSCLYFSRLASDKYKTPLGNSKQTPTQAKANDHPMSLCSQCGIQSLPSPRAPNMLTAIIPNIPDLKRDTPQLIKLNVLRRKFTNNYAHTCCNLASSIAQQDNHVTIIISRVEKDAQRK